jgi:hypothetical protein
MKRTVTQGILGSLGETFLPNLENFPNSKVGTLCRLFQLQPFPWIIKNTQNQNEQILAIPINAQSEPIQFSMEQLHLCKQVEALFFCNLEQLTTVPTQESCLIALATKHYSAAVHLCQFSISRPIELLYQLQSEKYLLYSADRQPQVYKCLGDNWSGLTITAGISFLIFSGQCDLNLTKHRINYLANDQPVPVIELFEIASVSKQPRKFYTKMQTFIELVAFCILMFLAIIVSVCAIIKRINGPRINL